MATFINKLKYNTLHDVKDNLHDLIKELKNKIQR
jgi:hypothetical protein